MDNITQKQVAQMCGVTEGFLSQYRSGNRYFSKKRARRLSVKTGIPFDVLAFQNGETSYKALVFAYQQWGGK
jgi:transcriptional regulator with XRE-family HTH domain